MLHFKDIKSAVIIGASEDTKKIGNILLKKNQDFTGKIYGINPKWGTAYGINFYEKINTLPEVPDIAVYAIPESLIYESLEEAGKFGIKKVIIITAGFKEIGNIEWENKIKSIAKKYNIRLLWPNCLGYWDTNKKLNLSFWGNFFDRWNIGIISQSWAMAVAITDILSGKNLWFSSFFSLWNKSDIDETDILQELYDDDNTKVIAVYLESINRWELFIEKLSSISRKKPVIVMLGWVSEKWKIATASHTGSLSWNKWMYEAAIKQWWAILTYSLEEFIDLLEIFSLNYEKEIHWLPFIITNAWWPWVLATDQADFHNLWIATIDTNTSISIKYNMPSMMGTKNPIDIIGDADSTRVKQILINLSNVTPRADIIFLFTVQATTDIDEIARTIVEFSIIHKKYNIFVGLIGWSTIINAQSILSQAGIYVSKSTESIITSYTHLKEWKIWKDEQKILAIEKKEIPNWETALINQNETENILKKYNIQTTRTQEFWDINDLINYTDNFSWPYVLKIAWEHIVHKTELGWVIGSLNSKEEILIAYEKIKVNIKNYSPDQEIERLSIGKFISPSPALELFFWAKRDSTFWDTFIIGAGWIFLTILDDTRIHIGKLDKETIIKIIKSLRSYPAICWYRKQKEVDLDLLSEMIYSLSELFRAHHEISEIDINPILFENGLPCIADAKFYTIKSN
jgi:acyl-CoA synthetase (NDP forming)